MITLLHSHNRKTTVDHGHGKRGSHHVQLELSDADKIARIVFDRNDSTANIFDETALCELEEHVTWIEAHASELDGVVFLSAKPKIFLAGADIKTLNAASYKQLGRIIGTGQVLFERIARLPMPTVAAIHGACLGGGLELALACDWRIASPDKATKIGLPEVMLGILPAWGGSTRLPRLIGLPAALSMILTGRQLKAKPAIKLGVIDAIVERAHLEGEAERFVTKGKRPEPRFPIRNSRLVAAIAVRKARKNILAKTRGNYPAPPKALEVAARSLRVSTDESLENERNAILELSELPETKNLIRAFLLNERAKKKNPNASPPSSKHAVVIGAGVMGSGIAYWLASRGYRVTMQDIDNEAAAAGMKRIHRTMEEALKRRIVTKLEARDLADRIFATAVPVPLETAGIVIEAATENLDIKREIFRDLATRTRPDTLLVTNTSALPISRILEGADIPHPERVLGMHFFNPVHRMPLVEVVRGENTDATAVRSAAEFVRAIGKVPVVVGDSPGFVVNRVLMPCLMEAGNLFDRGVIAQEIDDAMLDFGMPMGPLRLLDEVGLDVALHVSQTLSEAFPDRFTVPPLLERMIDSGLFGKKCGAGFYRYDLKGKCVGPNMDALACHRGASRKEDHDVPIGERLALAMTNEAAHCLREGVAARPEDVDLAMLLGTGWAPFRGGPLRHANTVGLPDVVSKLESLSRTDGPLYEPCGLLRRWDHLESILKPRD